MNDLPKAIDNEQTVFADDTTAIIKKTHSTVLISFWSNKGYASLVNW